MSSIKRKSSQKAWMEGIGYEIAFWNNVCRWNHTFRDLMAWSNFGSLVKLDCFDANSYLSSLEQPKVLDVGCGMSYATGNLYGPKDAPKSLDIHYVDPLAHQYNKILRRHHRDLPQIEYGMMEYLSAFFHDVDLVIIQNALDHSASPIEGIIESLKTLRLGGILYLNHHPNEAEMEKYKGFHQWNIEEDNHHQLVIWNREKRIVVNDVIGSFCQIDVSLCENGFIVAVIKKIREFPEQFAYGEDGRKQLCNMLMDNYIQMSNPLFFFKEKINYWKYNLIQFFVQILPWEYKMKIKKIIKQH